MKMLRSLFAALLFTSCVFAQGKGASNMQITSSKFTSGAAIPSIYTCEGKNWNPPLEFKDVPKEAKSLILIMEDPDVPTSIRPDGLMIHWVVYGISPFSKGISENSAQPGILGVGYQGPCPPDRQHRYFFYLYAIDFMPNWKKGLSKEEVAKKIEGHVLAKVELMGTYKKKSNK